MLALGKLKKYKLASDGKIECWKVCYLIWYKLGWEVNKLYNVNVIKIIVEIKQPLILGLPHAYN